MFTTRLFTSPANIDVYRAVSRRLVAERTLQSHHFAAGGVYTDLPYDIGHQVSMEQLAQYIPADLRPIEQWAMSPEGEATFNHLVDASIAYFEQYGHMVAPAHDLRHMLVKDMAEALRFAEEGQVTGYKRFFLIASLWHDMGRLLEAHFDEAGLEPAVKVPHAVLSFGLLRDFLAAETPELPKALREQLLYAVQVHSGRNGECFIARAVQRADRFQLLGAEGFLRAVAYVSGVEGHPLKLNREPSQINTPDMDSLAAVPNVVDYIGRNLYDNISFDDGKRERVLRAQSRALVRLMIPDDDRFHLDSTAFSVSLNHPSEQEIATEYYAFLTRLNEARDLADPDIRTVLSEAGNAPLTEEVLEKLEKAYNDLTLESQELLNLTLKTCALLQIEGDREDYEFLNALLAQKGASSPEGKLAALAIAHGDLSSPRSLPARNAEADKEEGRSASPQTDPALKL